jgi:hypothetical protein
MAVTIRSSVINKKTGRHLTDFEVRIGTFGPDGLVTRFVHVVDRHAQAWRGEDV